MLVKSKPDLSLSNDYSFRLLMIIVIAIYYIFVLSYFSLNGYKFNQSSFRIVIVIAILV